VTKVEQASYICEFGLCWHCGSNVVVLRVNKHAAAYDVCSNSVEAQVWFMFNYGYAREAHHDDTTIEA
jgi:hypothetical protein